jgi:hypothetical protein
MPEFDLGELLKQAEEAGGLDSSAPSWQDGTYRMSVSRASYSTKPGKAPQLSLFWRMEDGEYVGQCDWDNNQIDLKNEIGIKILLSKLVALGISKEFMQTNPPMEQIAFMLEGEVAMVKFSTKPWKTDATKLGKTFRVIKRLTDLDETEEITDSEEGSGGIFG